MLSMKRIEEQVLLELIKHNFIVKALQGCFNIVARKDDKILLIKVLEDANSVTPDMTQELINTSAALHASPIIISEKATVKLKDNVVYTRYNIPTISVNTLISYLDNNPVYMLSKKSGITARIIGRQLKTIRESGDISLGKLSRVIGVSKRMLLRYENGDAEISLQRAMRMYQIVGNKVFQKVDLLTTYHQYPHQSSSDIYSKYENLGFKATETKKVPFDIIASRENILILTSVGDKVNKDLNNISHTIGANDLAIFTKKKPQNIPALSKEEFLEFEKASSLIRFIQEYGE